MANRYLKRDRGSLEQGLVDLYVQVAIGSTGACTLSTANSKGIASITRNSAGNYTLALQDVYQRLMDFNSAIILSSGDPVVDEVVVRADGSNTVAAPVVTIGYLNSAGTATDPASGCTLLLHLVLKNSTV